MEQDMRPARDRASDSGKRIVSMLWRIAVVAILIGIGSHPSSAQEASVQPQWQALVTPYLWMPWTGVGVNPSPERLPSKSGTIDFGQLVDHLSWVPFMGSAEFRNGDYGILLDYLHAPVRTGLNTPNILFGGAGVGLTIDSGSAMFLYRAFAQPNQYLDLGAGARVWGFNTVLSLNEGLLRPVSITNGGAWADPLLAVRYHYDFGNGFGATAYGDVGGFGLAANVDWQVIGTIDYAYRSWIDLHAGFRSLNFDYSLPRAGLDMHMYGPIIAATFRF
jgi:hypothetical protein